MIFNLSLLFTFVSIAYIPIGRLTFVTARGSAVFVWYLYASRCLNSADSWGIEHDLWERSGLLKCGATTTSVAVRPEPPFITDEFALELLMAMAGQTTSRELRKYIDEHYTGFDKNAWSYLMAQLGRLRASRYVDTVWNYRNGRSGLTYAIRDEVKPIIAASGYRFYPPKPRVIEGF